MKTTPTGAAAIVIPLALSFCLQSLSHGQGRGTAPPKNPTVTTDKKVAGEWTVTPGDDPVDGAVNDFHLCLNDAIPDVLHLHPESQRRFSTPFELALLKGVGKMPAGWTVRAAEDSVTGRMCLNFYRGTGAALTSPTRGKFWFSTPKGKEFSRIDLKKTTVFVTNSPEEEENWHAHVIYPLADTSVPPVVTSQSSNGSVLYTVNAKSAEVRDFHVCLSGPRDTDGTLAEKIKKGLNVQIPANWTTDVSYDAEAQRWCVNFNAGRDGSAIPAGGHFVFDLHPNGAGVKLFPNSAGKDDATVYVTNSQFSEQNDWQHHILNPPHPGVGNRPMPDTAFGWNIVADVVPASPSGLAPQGSRLYAPTQATVGGYVLCSVLGPNQATLAGVVVSNGSERKATNEKGQVVFQAAAGLSALALTLLTEGGPQTSGISLVNAPASAATTLSAPQYVAVGDQATLKGTGFDASSGTTSVSVGNTPASVLAASSVELDVVTAPTTPLGAQTVVVTDSNGSATAQTQAIQIALTSASTAITTGGSMQATATITGTTDRVPLLFMTSTPNVLMLQEGNAQTKLSTGGDRNVAQVKGKGLSAGAFSLSVTTKPGK